jgi:hypothetical protein
MRGSLAVALAVVAAGCGCGESAETGNVGQRSDRPQDVVLHLRDLPRGYEYGDDTVCGAVSATEGEWPKLEPLFADERPNACFMELQWVWEGEPPYSRLVTSAAYVFGDAAGARRAYEARDEIALFTATLRVRERETLDLGDEAELLRGGGLNNPASGVVWRDGEILAAVVLEPAKDDAARELAEMQQERLEQPAKPSPQKPENDPELQLDDPTLELPVYWLGREFDPPGDVPPLELELATVGGTGPGQSVQLWYRVGGGVADTVTLDTWEPDAWERFRRTRLGRLIWDSPCARKKTIPVNGGRAEIFQGYGEPKPVEPPCPKRSLDRVLAHVYYDEVVVAVNMPYCYDCARPEPRPSPYETVEATETLVRSLRLQTPRR